MWEDQSIVLILPARNEEKALPSVIKHVPREIDRIIIVNNGSTDRTAEVAGNLGAEVVDEPKKGYGRACLRGLATLEADPPDIVAFADADGSDDVAGLGRLLQPLLRYELELALEKRLPSEPGVFSIQQRFGNRLSTFLIRLFWGHAFADLGPMRAIRWRDLQELKMKDQNFGWTVEMQIRSLKCGFRIREYPFFYKKRAAGHSKVSRSLIGSARAGIKILWVIFRELLRDRRVYSGQYHLRVPLEERD